MIMGEIVILVIICMFSKPSILKMNLQKTEKNFFFLVLTRGLNHSNFWLYISEREVSFDATLVQCNYFLILG